MLIRVIIFLVRKQLGVGKYEEFQFANQKNKNEYYYFDKTCLRKNVPGWPSKPSSVSLNWLLNPMCEIIKREDPDHAGD